MSRVPALVALAFTLTLLPVIDVASQVEPGQTFTARVVSVTDGDTYDVKRSAGSTVKIRLHGVDAPESSQPFGEAAFDGTKGSQHDVAGPST